jgi:hypothetical protein
MAAYPGSNELITATEAKSLMNISVSTYDTFINANIPVISRAIENYCRRRFLDSQWTQWTMMDRELMLDNWPITNVYFVGNPQACIKITDTTNKYNFTVTQAQAENLNIVSKFTVTDTTAFTSTDFLFATYTTIGALKTAVEAAVVGVTFAYEQDPPTMTFASQNTLLLRQSSGKTLYCAINYFDASASTALGDVYRISDSSDRLLLNPAYAEVGHSFYSGNYQGPYTTGIDNMDTGWAWTPLDWYMNADTCVVYRSGWTTAQVPQELKWVVASILKDLMSLYDLESSGVYKGIYRGETLGDYSYTLDGNAKIPQLLDRYASQLDYFKKKVIA